MIFLALMCWGLSSTSFAETTPINYHFDDTVRGVEYPKCCAGCGAQLLSIQAVPPPEPKNRISVSYPRGEGDYKKTAYLAMESSVLQGKGVFTSIGGSLYYVGYDPNKIDFYYEKELGKLDNTSFYIQTMKYRIDPLTAGDKKQYIIGPSSQNGSYPFFVCSNCAKCDKNGCQEYVASNGFSIPAKSGYEKDTSKLVVGKYCQNHTCAFIWNVDNGNFNISTVEGIDCKKKAMDGSLFCEAHTCKDPLCNKPVVGWNSIDGRSTAVRVYQGPDSNQYSNYCVDHFCKHYTCKEKRFSVTSLTAKYSSSEGRYIQFPEYCALHGNDCTIYGCNEPVIKTHYDEKNKNIAYICEYHAEHYEELQNQAMELGMLPEEVTPESDIIRDYCSNCKKYLIREKKSTGQQCGKVIGGKWYCSVCAAQNFTVTGSVNDFETGGGYMYHVVPPSHSQFADPENCTHSRYPVPNTVSFTNITKETHTQVWTCINCNTTQREKYEHEFIKGVCVCGYSLAGYVPEEDPNNEDPNSEDPNNEDPNSEDPDNEDPNNENEYNPLVEITNAKYIMPYDDEKKILLVQLKDNDVIKLKIAKDKLTTLTYKWGTKVVGYSDSSVKIPSNETLYISDGNSNVTGYVMEKPDYILEIQYYPKGSNKKQTITYQIYLP
jgi:predicted  nucleic acid-binding Zn-ribbon protein